MKCLFNQQTRYTQNHLAICKIMFYSAIVVISTTKITLTSHQCQLSVNLTGERQRERAVAKNGGGGGRLTKNLDKKKVFGYYSYVYSSAKKVE